MTDLNALQQRIAAVTRKRLTNRLESAVKEFRQAINLPPDTLVPDLANGGRPPSLWEVLGALKDLSFTAHFEAEQQAAADKLLRDVGIVMNLRVDHPGMLTTQSGGEHIDDVAAIVALAPTEEGNG